MGKILATISNPIAQIAIAVDGEGDEHFYLLSVTGEVFMRKTVRIQNTDTEGHSAPGCRWVEYFEKQELNLEVDMTPTVVGNV